MGYHLKKIEKGELGEASKILEEAQELMDAEEQGIKILALCELADLVGAIDQYLRKHHPELKLNDLMRMAAATESAFKDGSRKSS